MSVGKYKYYFKKPKSEITKDIFKWLMIAGAVGIAATSPYFINNLLSARKKFSKYPKQKIQNTFYKFKKQGLISIRCENNQIYISLTAEGKKKAGWMQMGFKPFQKSVWICPFDCEAEISLLKDFFNFSDKELKLITAENIGGDAEWKEVFKLV